MKKIIFATVFAVMTSPAFAAVPTDVPEMDASAGVAAVALLAGIAAIIREKMKK